MKSGPPRRIRSGRILRRTPGAHCRCCDRPVVVQSFTLRPPVAALRSDQYRIERLGPVCRQFHPAVGTEDLAHALL